MKIEGMGKYMKKWMKGLAVGFLALGLAACGEQSQEPAKPQTGTDEENTSELTLEEVFAKAQEASENVDSMHADMDIQQKITSPALDGEVDSAITMQMDMIQEPLAMHQVMEMDVPDMGKIETEMYISELGFFMKNPEGEEWMKLPSDSFDEITGSLGTSADATVDYASLEEFIEDFKFEQTNDQYVLKLKASGEKFKKLVQEELDGAGMTEDMGEEELAALEDMTIHELEYELFIDKESFQTTAFNLIMDMEMNAEGEVIRMKQDIQAKLSQINDISEIVVPEEVIENAVEY